MPRTLLCLVRHGETAWNAEGRVQGQLDVPLNGVGLSQARAVANALCTERFDVIYSSDLARVTQTAEPLARRLQLPLQVDPRLRERHYGFFQTRTYAEVKVQHPADYARFRSRDLDYDFRTGESLQAFYERCIACLSEIARRHPGESILVFTHGGVLEMAYRFAQGLDLRSVRDFGIPNAGLNRLAIEGDAWSVLKWADCAHLATALDDLPG